MNTGKKKIIYTRAVDPHSFFTDPEPAVFQLCKNYRMKIEEFSVVDSVATRGFLLPFFQIFRYMKCLKIQWVKNERKKIEVKKNLPPNLGEKMNAYRCGSGSKALIYTKAVH